VRARTRCAQTHSILSEWSPGLQVNILPYEVISIPDAPSGPTSGITGTNYAYSTGGAYSNFGHFVQYFFDWGDGTNSGWLPYWTKYGGGIKEASKSWMFPGIFLVKAQARCVGDTSVVSDWSPSLTVTINPAPLPDLTGQWNSLTQTCQNTLKGTKCSLKGKFTLQNIGLSDASSSKVKFYLSDNSSYDGGDTLLKEITSETISAGGSLTGNIKFNLPTGQTASGKYVIALIDADNTVVESNENNNKVVYGPIP
jgi:hypothetical protein